MKKTSAETRPRGRRKAHAPGDPMPPPLERDVPEPSWGEERGGGQYEGGPTAQGDEGEDESEGGGRGPRK